MSDAREQGARSPSSILRPSSFILLVGLRGSGKTTIGRIVAERLRVSFVDLDDRTPALLGCRSVAEAWARHGEPAFRKAEVEALRAALSQSRSGVLALGGGTPTAPEAAEVLRAAQRAGAAIVYLRARPATLRERLRNTDLGQRPALTGTDPLSEIDAVFAARDPLYCALASRIVETDDLAVEAAAEAVLAPP